MKKFLKEMYGVAIIFFYYTKWFILIGLPILYFELDYDSNSVMNVLWCIALGLALKDFVYLVILKKKY